MARSVSGLREAHVSLDIGKLEDSEVFGWNQVVDSWVTVTD